MEKRKRKKHTKDRHLSCCAAGYVSLLYLSQFVYSSAHSLGQQPDASILILYYCYTTDLYYLFVSITVSKPILAMEYVGEEYYRMRNTVNKYERYILKVSRVVGLYLCS